MQLRLVPHPLGCWVLLGLVGSGCNGPQASLPAAVRDKLQQVDNGDAAASAEGRMPRVSPTPGFTISMRDEWSVQQTVSDALRRIGSPAVPSLVRSLKSPDAAVRMRAADVLGRMGPDAKDAVPDLIEALGDDEATVRKMSIRALGQIGPGAAAAVPALIRILNEDVEP